MKRILVAWALALSACGAPAAASPSPSPVTVATPSPTASPTVGPAPTAYSPAASAAKHITASVTELMNLSGDPAIEAWINRESDWLHSQPSLPVLRPYVAAFLKAAVTLLYKDENTNLALTALDIIAAAREVPGVELP